MIRKIHFIVTVTVTVLALCSLASATGNPFQAKRILNRKYDLKMTDKFRSSPAHLEKSGKIVGNALALEIPRGGGQGKALFVRIHALSALFFSAFFLTESFGISLPIIGFATAFPGFELTDVTRLLFRVLCSLELGIGLAELALADDIDMQNLFTIYHVPLVLALLFNALQQKTLGSLIWVAGPAFCFSGALLSE